MTQFSNKKENSLNNDKADESLKNAPLPPLPFENQIKKDKASAKDSIKPDDETTQIIQNIRQMREKLEQLLQETYEKTGWSPQFLKNYLNNSNNFNDKDIDKIQVQREELIDTIRTPSFLKKEIKKNLSQSQAPKTAKERHTKTAGARRKWMPMR